MQANAILKANDLLADMDAGKQVVQLKIGINKIDGKPKVFTGTLFANTTLTATVKGAKASGPGLIMLDNDVVLSSGLPNPLDTKDPRNGFEGSGGQMIVTLAKAGKFGSMICHLSDQFQQAIADTFIKIPIVVDGIDMKKVFDASPSPTCPIKKLYEDRYGRLHPTKPNEEREPILRMKIVDGLYPEKHPISNFRGQPKFHIYDYNTRAIVDGKVKYELMKVPAEDGTLEPLTFKNAHKVIVNGVTLKAGTIIQIPSAVKSEKGITMPVHIWKAIVDTSTVNDANALVMPDEADDGSMDSLESTLA